MPNDKQRRLLDLAFPPEVKKVTIAANGKVIGDLTLLQRQVANANGWFDPAPEKPARPAPTHCGRCYLPVRVCPEHPARMNGNIPQALDEDKEYLRRCLNRMTQDEVEGLTVRDGNGWSLFDNMSNWRKDTIMRFARMKYRDGDWTPPSSRQGTIARTETEPEPEDLL